MRRRTVLTLVAGGLLALPAATSAPAQTGTPDYATMFVKAGKKTVQAKLGTHCHPDGAGSGKCVDATYPLEGAPTLTVRAGGEITLLLRAPVASLLWRTARIDASGEELLVDYGRGRATTKTLRRFTITLPRTMRASHKVIGFDVNYPSGGFYSSFEIRARVLKPLPKTTK